MESPVLLEDVASPLMEDLYPAHWSGIEIWLEEWNQGDLP